MKLVLLLFTKFQLSLGCFSWELREEICQPTNPHGDAHLFSVPIFMVHLQFKHYYVIIRVVFPIEFWVQYQPECFLVHLVQE